MREPWGQGSEITSIMRQHDQFIQLQINDESSNSGRWTSANAILREVEIALTEDEEYGLNKTMNDFWNGWADLANEPFGYVERSSLVSTASRMADSFRRASESLQEIRDDLDQDIQVAVEEINNLTSNIADLNAQIFAIDINDRQGANDLYDHRDQKLRELSEYVDFDLVVDDEGKHSLFLKDGSPLVTGHDSWDLKADSMRDDSRYMDVEWENRGGDRTSVSDVIGNGKLRTYIEQRDEYIPQLVKEIDRLAAKMIQEVNGIHSRAYGQDGSSGNNFFEQIKAESLAK